MPQPPKSHDQTHPAPIPVRDGRGPLPRERRASIGRARSLSVNVSSAASYQPDSRLASSHDGRRTEGLSNWQALEDVFGEDEDEEGGVPLEDGGLRPRLGSFGGVSMVREGLSSRELEEGFGGAPRAEGQSLEPPKRHLGQLEERAKSHETIPTHSAALKARTASKHRHFFQQLWPLHPVAKVVLKCSLAYFIASLFTFIPALASLLSTAAIIDDKGRVIRQPAEMGHMVATMVVFFNSGKSLGNMILSNRYCFGLVSIATIASLLSISTFRLFDRLSASPRDQWDFVRELGDWLVCVLWIGGTMGVIAWSKVWIGSLHFNGGCSMAAILLYNVVLRDGEIPKLLEILEIICIGVCITNLVNLVVFPVSATTTLQTSISTSLNSFSTLLDLLTSTFLLEKTIVKDNRISLKDAIKSHAAAFNTLKVDLAEAKRERVLDGRIRGRKLHLYEAAVASLGRLAQHLSGLRSCERLQENLIKASREGRIRWEVGEDGRPRLAIADVGPDDEEDSEVEASVRLLVEFREMAGEQMDALNLRCDEALDAVQALSRHDVNGNVNLLIVRSNLANALHAFRESSNKAIARVYAGPGIRRTSSSGSSSGRTSSASGRSGEGRESTVFSRETRQDGPNEAVFLIYFFLFTFEEFAREMLFLLDTMGEIVTSKQISAWEQIKAFAWKKGCKVKKRPFMYTQFQNIVPVGPSKLQDPLFPKNSRNTTSQLTERLQPRFTKFERFMQAWGALEERLEQPDMRYAIKTGLGGAMLALPAYTETTREIFLHYRGEWALVAYLSAMSQTVGQTNYISLARIFGTIFGGLVAVLFSELFPEDHIMLPILGFLFSMVCFYVITQKPDYTDAGRFTLLTYNLSCLFAYNTRMHGDVTVELIAFERTVSVMVGIIWAGVVSRYWWPFTARRELRMGLSDFCLDLSYLYSKLVTTYSKGVDAPNDAAHHHCDCASTDNGGDDQPAGERTPLLPTAAIGRSHLSQSVRQFMAMELHLQSQLGSLRDLLAHTKNEPRLKGPFAYDFYHEVLLSCERVLDRLHSMRCVTTRDEWDDHMRRTFVVPVNAERREMAGNVVLYFYTLSAGLRLRTPMPPYLPPAEIGRQRLVSAIRSLDVVRRRSVRGGGRHLLFFAYALAMQEVIAELEHLGGMMQDAFGVIPHGTARDFEALFQDEGVQVVGDDLV
ncbi:hypothetical protein IAT38_002269 [Cryptococcus sp. DSM 104549]